MTPSGARGGRQPVLPLGGGAVLRPWSLDDAVDLLQLMADPLVRHYSPAAVDDLDAARTWVLARRDWWAGARGGAWAVDDGSGVVGSAVARDLDADLGLGSVGYALAPAARGRGLATAACDAVARAVLTQLGWHRLELYHAVENAASCAVARRCGFLLEGTMRQAMRYADGRWSDEHLHARLAEDPPPRT